MRTYRLIPMALAAAVALPAGVAYAAEGVQASHWRVYIGCGAREPGAGIRVLDMDGETGHTVMREPRGEAAASSYLALHPSLPLLYAVNGADGGSVCAYRIDRDTGALTLLNRQSSAWDGPCHVAIAPGGRRAAVANYSGGTIAQLSILDDGRLGEASGIVRHEGHSVNPQRQEGPHPHCVAYDPAGRFLLTVDLGLDRVLVYRADDEAGKLPPNEPPFASVTPGAGPRHIAFHPSGRWAYVVNELGNTVTAFAYDAKAGRLDALQTVGTLPEGFSGDNTTAAIRVHPSGRFVYASNRGHDSIAVFRVDVESGKLTPAGHALTEGKTPRDFNLDPAGKYLLAANQDSGNVVVLRIEAETGMPQPTGERVELPGPCSIVFVAM